MINEQPSSDGILSPIYLPTFLAYPFDGVWRLVSSPCVKRLGRCFGATAWHLYSWTTEGSELVFVLACSSLVRFASTFALASLGHHLHLSS